MNNGAWMKVAVVQSKELIPIVPVVGKPGEKWFE